MRVTIAYLKLVAGLITKTEKTLTKKRHKYNKTTIAQHRVARPWELLYPSIQLFDYSYILLVNGECIPETGD